MNITTPEKIQYRIAKGTFRPNIYLTNLSMSYFQQANRYVAKAIFPICPVPLSSARFYTFSKGRSAERQRGQKAAIWQSAARADGSDGSELFLLC